MGVFLRVTAITLVLMVSGALSATSSPNENFERTYRERFAELMRNRGVVNEYAPLEAVPGRFVALPQAPRRTLSSSALDAADRYAAAHRSSALLVWRNGALEISRYYGATTSQTPLVSKSLSKPLGAIAVGRAIALGKIRSLDQPVADFIPEWRGTPKAAILVRHLLDMRSGLLEQAFTSDPASPLNRAYIHPDHGRELIERYPLTSQPGSRFGYSNASAELVAPLIERATGRRYAEFVGNEILVPLGAAGGDIWIDRPGGLAHSGCCMHLPAETWLKLAILLYDDGRVGSRRLLPKGFVAKMTTGTSQNPWYGLGVWVAGPYTQRRGFSGVGGAGPQVLHSEPYLDRDLFLFDGNSDQVVYVSRAARLVVLRLGDTPPKTPEWDNTALPNLLIRGIERGPRPRAAQPR